MCSTLNSANNEGGAETLDNDRATSCERKTPAIIPGWTVGRAIDECIRRLEAKNVTEPDYSALYLAAAALKLPWEQGIRDLQVGSGRSGRSVSNANLRSKPLTAEQASDLEGMLKRREAHEPIQYVLGKWDFLDYTIAIRRPLLCPRPETEELVSEISGEIAKERSSKTNQPLRILDVGCGTGVIGISLADLLPDAVVEAIDVEPVAVAVSTENAEHVLGGSAADRYQAKLCPAADFQPNQSFDVVVSNPPYIPRADMETLTDDVWKYESDRALCGGDDGLDVVRTIIEKLPEWCSPRAVCWMEVDPTHPRMIEELLSREDGGSATGRGRRVCFESSYKDMFGKDRFVKLRVE